MKTYGPTTHAFVIFCKKCNDTSFPLIIEPKCSRCGQDYDKKDLDEWKEQNANR